MKPNYYETNFEVKILREYLRIPSSHPDVDYEPCVEFLKQQAILLDLPVAVYYPRKRAKPVVVITWTGLNPKLPAVMFNSNMDVSPVFPEEWRYPPFGAEIDSEGRIFACGIQDSKASGMQYLAAIRLLKKQGYQGERTAHITFMPDKELNGVDGMKSFVNTNAFRSLNIEFAVDKGIPSRSEVMPICFGERASFEATFKIRGSTGDPSLMPKHTAGEKFNLLLKKLMDLRKDHAEKLRTNCKLKLGDITTANLTKTKTNAASVNNLPQMIEATFDIRLAANIDPKHFGLQLLQFFEEIGGGIEMTIADDELKRGITVLDNSNTYWVAFKNALQELKVDFELQMHPGNTDMRYLRDEKIRIAAINFSPMPDTPKLSYDHNEFLHARTYLRGIEIFAVIMRYLLTAGVESEPTQETGLE